MTTAQINLHEFNGYVAEPNGWFRIFKTDNCEHCGAQIEAANAFSIQPRGGVAVLARNGLKAYAVRLPEGYYSDAVEGEACEVCNA